MFLEVIILIRTYAISNGAFLPTVFSAHKKSVYITNELYIALYRAPINKLQEANAQFIKDTGTEDYQLVCLVGDGSSQTISDFELKDIVIEVPVSKVYKVD